MSASARNSLLGSLLLMLIILVSIVNSNINRVADIKTYPKLTHPMGKLSLQDLENRCELGIFEKPYGILGVDLC
jgi:hypothetical protein